MTWEYALIGLVVGIAIGAVAMRFGNRKLRQQQALRASPFPITAPLKS
jgi:uncharacterized membrane-anchored protein YhcB (DUF1043 family)